MLVDELEKRSQLLDVDVGVKAAVQADLRGDEAGAPKLLLQLGDGRRLGGDSGSVFVVVDGNIRLKSY